MLLLAPFGCSAAIKHYFNLSRNAFWEIRVQLVRDTSHPGNKKSPARQKSRPKTSLALFSYVQINQFAPYCLKTSSPGRAGQRRYTPSTGWSLGLYPKLGSLSNERPFKPSWT